MSDVKTVPCQHDESYKVDPRNNVPYDADGRVILFRMVSPDPAMRFLCEIDSFTKMPGGSIQIAAIENCRACLKDILEQLVSDPENAQKFFTDSTMGPGSWPRAMGCAHYLKNLFPTTERAFDWLRYCYDYDSGDDPNDGGTPREFLAEMEALFIAEYEKVEVRPAAVSLSGGYGYLFDGSHHYCSPQCALLGRGFSENVTPEQEIELKIAFAL